MERTERGEVAWVNWALHAMESEHAAQDIREKFNNSWASKRKGQEWK